MRSHPAVNKNAMTIRPAEFKDAPGISRLIKRFSSRLIQRSIGDIVQNVDRFFVCEVRGRIAGTVSWQILPEAGTPHQPSVEIQSLAVRRDLHRTGIGRMLVETAIARVRTLHPAQVIALTFTPGFFRKLGFRVISKRKLMHKIYMGCINCTKYDSPFTCPEVAMVMKLNPPPPAELARAGK